MLVGCAGESPFTLELDPLPQDIIVERDIFSFWSVLSKSIWLDIVVSLLKAFLGIAAAGGIRLASLEDRKLLMRDDYLLQESFQG